MVTPAGWSAATTSAAISCADVPARSGSRSWPRVIGRLARISRLQGPVVDWVVVGPVCLLAGARRGQLPGALGCLDPSKERLVPASCACISCRTKARGEVWPLVLWVAHSSREQGEAPAAGLLLFRGHPVWSWSAGARRAGVLVLQRDQPSLFRRRAGHRHPSLARGDGTTSRPGRGRRVRSASDGLEYLAALSSLDLPRVKRHIRCAKGWSVVQSVNWDLASGTQVRVYDKFTETRERTKRLDAGPAGGQLRLERHWRIPPSMRPTPYMLVGSPVRSTEFARRLTFEFARYFQPWALDRLVVSEPSAAYHHVRSASATPSSAGSATDRHDY